MRTLLATLALSLPLLSPSAHAIPASEVTIEQVDPITQQVIAGLAVEVIKGLTTLIQGDGRAQVQAAAQHTGPDGDDKAFGDDSDVDDWKTEVDLDANTGNIIAPNGGSQHIGWAELHYTFSAPAGGDKAWRPNLEDFEDKNGRGGYTWNGAYPEKDTTPQPGDTGSEICKGPNATCSASVSAFGVEGVIKEKFVATGSALTQSVAGPGQAVGLQQIGGPDPGIFATSFATMTFTPGAFAFDRVGDKVTISPLFDGPAIDVIHSTANAATLGPDPALIAEQYIGLTPFGSALMAQVLTDVATNSNGHAVFSPGVEAQLTLAGAALAFSPLTLDRFDAAGNELSDYQLLAGYFSSPVAVEIVAPEEAQAGYVPNVLHREVIVGGTPVNGEGIHPELQPALFDPMLDGMDPLGNVLFEPVPLIGLLIGVEGSLLDALNLSASTPGTFLNQFLSGLAEGEEFELEISLSSSGAAYLSMMQTIDVSTPIPAPTTLQLLLVGFVAMLMLRPLAMSR